MERSHLALEFSKIALRHPHWALVERVAASQYFQSSARLRDFLFYVADCALKDAPEEATEQQVGIYVFQRPPGYNCADDSIVRTHARSLRQKLAEYFQNEGRQEDVIIEIPKGHYLPVFHPRTQEMAAPSRVAAPELEPGDGKLRQHRRRIWLMAFPLAACLVGAAWWGMHRTANDSTMDRFWDPFFSNNASLVIYSNALFVGNAYDGLRYAPSSADSTAGVAGDYVDSYTGVGEVASVYELTRLFDSHHATFTLKRSLLVTWDEAKLKNLIFVGAVAQNPALRVMPATMDFTSTWGVVSSEIVNLHPRPGESAVYSRLNHPLTHDYAIVALLPGLESGRKSLVLSGLTTIGTQAAMDFACRPESLEQLLRAATGPNGVIRPFEAVIETTLGGGEPLQTRLITIHVH